VRTFNGWKDVKPGWFEMDLVGHCRGRMECPFLGSHDITDVTSAYAADVN
jgi:hypothetical protein